MDTDRFVIVGTSDPHEGHVSTWSSPSPFPVGWTDADGRLWWRCYSPRPGAVDDVELIDGEACTRVYLFQLVPGELHPWTFERRDDGSEAVAAEHESPQAESDGGTVAYLINDAGLPDHGSTVWHGGKGPGPFSRPWTDGEGRHWHRCYAPRPGARDDVVETDRGPARSVYLFKVVRGSLDPWSYTPLAAAEVEALFGPG